MIKQTILKLVVCLSTYVRSLVKDEAELLAIGALLSKQQYSMNSININDYEFKIFSQFGDDGIIQYLVRNVAIENDTFIEFGVEDFLQSNTRFLMMNNNWSGFIMDSSEDALNYLKNQVWYWKYCLTHKAAFIDINNINDLLESSGLSNIGLLNIDLDGNDYHIFTAIDLSRLNPSIIIIEYNSVFGSERPITVPYRKDFIRTKAHSSNLYWGASLAALNFAASRKGYSLVGTNIAGNNAYFVRQDLLNEKVQELSVKSAFKDSKYRESRNPDYSFSFIAGKDRYEIIKGMDVVNVVNNTIEKA